MKVVFGRALVLLLYAAIGGLWIISCARFDSFEFAWQWRSAHVVGVWVGSAHGALEVSFYGGIVDAPVSWSIDLRRTHSRIRTSDGCVAVMPALVQNSTDSK